MSVNGQSAAGVTVPDTKLAREATELIRDRTSDLVYNHSRRVFFWGSRQGRNRDLSYDQSAAKRLARTRSAAAAALLQGFARVLRGGKGRRETE